MYKWLPLLLSAVLVPHLSDAIVEFKNWAFHFPANSNMGLFIALAVPIEDPNENVYIAWVMEANYLLPGNESDTFEWPPLVPEDGETRNMKNIDRNAIYKSIENKFKSYNFPGRECLLKIICEVATSYFVHNGILGDLVHILFTPSSSNNPGLSAAYSNAEEHGKNKKNCKRYEKKCAKSFSDLFPWTENI